MRAKFINEDLGFQRGLDPKEAMGIGISKYVKDAKVLYFPNNSSFFNINQSNKPANLGSTKLRYWILFPHISLLTADLIFGCIKDGKTVFTDNYKEADDVYLDFHYKEGIHTLPEGIEEAISNWFIGKADELMSKATRATKLQYINSITT